MTEPTTEYAKWICLYFILLNTVVYSKIFVHGESCQLSIFTLLKHLMMLVKYNLFRTSFLHLVKDTEACRACS